ncbi:MAG: hypothetical protein ABEK50_05380 [bacterium]
MRCWGLGAPGLWHDEALSHYYASQDPGWILHYAAGPINHPPLFFLLLKGWLSLGPTYHQAFVEGLNVLVALAGLGIVYRWIQVLRDWRWATFGAGILALHPFHVYFSTELRMYALAAFAVTAMVYFAVRLIGRQGSDTVNCWGWTLASLVCVYTHSFTLLPVILSVLWLGGRSFKTGRYKKFLWSLLVLILGYAPWGIFVIRQALRISGDYWLPPFQWDFLWTLALWFSGYIGPKGAGLYYWGIVSMAVAGFLFPLSLSFSGIDRSDLGLVWLVVLGPITLAVMVSLSGQSVFLYRVFFPLLPILLYPLVVGYDLMPFRVAVVSCGLLGLLLVTETVNLKNNPPNQYARDTADWITRNLDRDMIVLHTSGKTYFPSRFYHQGGSNEFFVGARDHLGVSLTPSMKRNLGNTRPVLIVYPGEEKPEWVQSLSNRVKSSRRYSENGRTFEALVLHAKS